MLKFGSIFYRPYYHHAYKIQDYVLSAYLGNPYFMEAKLKNHINSSELEQVCPEQLKATMDELFIKKASPVFIDALDKGLFNIRDLSLCQPDQRIDYLSKIARKESINLKDFIKPEKPDYTDIDLQIARFTRYK